MMSGPGPEVAAPALRRHRLAHGGVEGLAAAVRSGDVSATDLLRSSLERIASHDGTLHAFTQTFAAQTRLVAASPAAREGLLAGLPIAVKDNIDIAGQVTSLGLPLGAFPPAAADADVVARLRSAGALIVGKTNLPELATSAVTANAHYGDARNPWDVERTAGGSSGGSAVAVAADMAVAALGTDTAGSALIPAALTGVCGLRPTTGRISTRGVTPLSRTFDTVGVIAWEPADIAQVFRVLDDRDPAEPEAEAYGAADGPAGLRVGVLTGWFRTADDGVLARLDAAADRLAEAGASLRPVELPSARLVLDQARVIYASEVSAAFADLLDEGSVYSATVERRRTAGFAFSGADYARALRFRDRWRDEVGAAFADVDVLVCPTTPTTAPRIDTATEETTSALVGFTYPFCLAGAPALSLPCGTHDGLPVGMTLVAPPGADRRLLRIGAACHHAGLTGSARLFPPGR